MDYFKEYSSVQLEIVKDWVNKNSWLKEIVVEIKEESTPFHDAKILTSLSNEWLTVEVKEDEAYWFNKTGNVGLDAISAFNITSNLNHWIKQGQKGAWIEPGDYADFIKDIEVKKWGKLFTCDADVQLFCVKGRFLQAYNNKKIVTEQFQDLVTGNYRLRINDKASYKINDSWMSAVYLFNPLTDRNFRALEINNLEDLKNLF